MTKAEQTTQVKTELYNLTRNFVLKYQRHYYIQYQGEVEDLITDFYVDFLTPKSRIKGQEESLLDKFDPSITTLPYLVKIAVQRKLIDRSRADKGEVRIDPLLEEYGDSVISNLNLVHQDDVTIDSMEFEEDDILRAKIRFSTLPKQSQERIRKYYNEVKSCISQNFKSYLGGFLERDLTITIEGKFYECFQVTEKSLQFRIKGEVITFNRHTGAQRATDKIYQISPEEIIKFQDIECFKI